MSKSGNQIQCTLAATNVTSGCSRASLAVASTAKKGRLMWADNYTAMSASGSLGMCLSLFWRIPHKQTWILQGQHFWVDHWHLPEALRSSVWHLHLLHCCYWCSLRLHHCCLDDEVFVHCLPWILTFCWSLEKIMVLVDLFHDCGLDWTYKIMFLFPPPPPLPIPGTIPGPDCRNKTH